MTRRLLAAAATFTVLLAACGDDDSDTSNDTPVMTNEFGVETFEPGADNPWFDDSESFEPGTD